MIRLSVGGWLEKIFGLRGWQAANIFVSEGTAGWKKFNDEQDKTISLEQKSAEIQKNFNNQLEALTGSLKNLAVAGFGPEEIDLQVENNTLTVKGRPAQEQTQAVYLHRGIAGRAFERRFELADHIQVEAAKLENGLLHIDLKREIPEALKPRKIEVKAGKSQPAPTLSQAA